MRTRLIQITVLLAALALGGCQAGAMHGSDSPNAMQGQLTPPPAGDAATTGWSLTIGETAIVSKLDVSQAHDAARALKGKVVTITADTPQPPILTWNVRSIQIARLKGVIRHVAIDSRHPTEWMFATHLSNIAFDAFLDPSHIPAPEQWVGKQVQITAHFEGQTRTGLRLVADTIE